MFKKRKCENCNKNVSRKYKFCPNCGEPIAGKFKKINKKDKDLGMLGEDDQIPNQYNQEIGIESEFERFAKSIFGGSFGGKMIGKIFNNAVKILEKEMQKEFKNVENQNKPSYKHLRPDVKSNFQLFINGKKIKLTPYAEPAKVKEKKSVSIKKKNSPLKYFNQKNIEKFSSLPREEPSTNIRRLSKRIIYEIDTPGVKSEENISVIPFENSIEIKAIAEKKAYFKIIPLNLPIKKYKFSKEKILLELEADN